MNDPMIIYKVILKGSNAAVSIVDAPRAFSNYLNQLNEANVEYEIRIETIPPDHPAAQGIRERYARR